MNTVFALDRDPAGSIKKITVFSLNNGDSCSLVKFNGKTCSCLLLKTQTSHILQNPWIFFFFWFFFLFSFVSAGILKTKRNPNIRKLKFANVESRGWLLRSQMETFTCNETRQVSFKSQVQWLQNMISCACWLTCFEVAVQNSSGSLKQRQDRSHKLQFLTPTFLISSSHPHTTTLQIEQVSFWVSQRTSDSRGGWTSLISNQCFTSVLRRILRSYLHSIEVSEVTGNVGL